MLRKAAAALERARQRERTATLYIDRYTTTIHALKREQERESARDRHAVLGRSVADTLSFGEEAVNAGRCLGTT